MSTFITVNRNGISAMKTVFSPRGLGGEYVKCPQLSTQGGWGTKLVCVVVEWSFNEPNFLQKTKLLRFIYFLWPIIDIFCQFWPWIMYHPLTQNPAIVKFTLLLTTWLRPLCILKGCHCLFYFLFATAWPIW